MSHSASIQISEECQETITQFKTDTSLRALKLLIDDEVLRISDQIPISGSDEQDFNSLQDYLASSEPAFILVRLSKTVAHPEFVFVVYIPSSCPIRPRTIFASSRVSIQRQFSHIFTGLGDYFIDTSKELDYLTYVQQTKRDESALSFEELAQKQESSAATVAQIQLPTHDAFTWPVTDDLLALIDQMAQGNGPRYVAGAANQNGDGIELGGQGESASDVISKAPRYIAIRYPHDGKDINVFVLYCPDTSRPREKMVSSTCKHSFIKACTEKGLTFEKTFDIRDEDELTDANLEALIHPQEVDHGYGEIKVIQKPRRPGRR